VLNEFDAESLLPDSSLHVTDRNQKLGRANVAVPFKCVVEVIFLGRCIFVKKRVQFIVLANQMMRNLVKEGEIQTIWIADSRRNSDNGRVNW
jgi:hypothetical protein